MLYILEKRQPSDDPFEVPSPPYSDIELFGEESEVRRYTRGLASIALGALKLQAIFPQDAAKFVGIATNEETTIPSPIVPAFVRIAFPYRYLENNYNHKDSLSYALEREDILIQSVANGYATQESVAQELRDLEEFMRSTGDELWLNPDGYIMRYNRNEEMELSLEEADMKYIESSFGADSHEATVARQAERPYDALLSQQILKEDGTPADDRSERIVMGYVDRDGSFSPHVTVLRHDN